jgi:hypothetical protein
VCVIRSNSATISAAVLRPAQDIVILPVAESATTFRIKRVEQDVIWRPFRTNHAQPQHAQPQYAHNTLRHNTLSHNTLSHNTRRHNTLRHNTRRVEEFAEKAQC